MLEENNVCAVCNKVAHHRCSACHAVYYCNQKHQKSHWKTHSNYCQACKLVENSQLGKHYVATRNIKVGERVICDVAPLVTAPSYMRGFTDSTGNFSLRLAAAPVCLNCYIKLTEFNTKPCNTCGWPLCRKCTKHGTECEFTKKHRKSKVRISKEEYGQSHPAYVTVGVVRALALRENDPKSYQKLMNLQDMSGVSARFDVHDSIANAARFTKSLYEINDVEEAEICKIIGIILLNSYNVKTGEQSYAAVYNRASYIEHNCRPNCSKTFTDKAGVIFYAAVPITKGDHITTTYVKPIWGTKKRRKYLAGIKFFDCTCERCKDPTEFSTMFNAIKCPQKECDGYALPLTFLITRENCADFVCCKCKKTVSRKLTDTIEQSIINDRALLHTDNICECQHFIEKWKAFLHENNWHIVDLEVDMVLALMNAIPDLQYKSEEYLANVVKLCVKLAELFRILVPAENKTRALLLCLKFQATRYFNRKKLVPIDEKLLSAEECQKDLNEVQQLLRREPTYSMEHLTLLGVCNWLEKLKEFKKTALQIPPANYKDMWF